MPSKTVSLLTDSLSAKGRNRAVSAPVGLTVGLVTDLSRSAGEMFWQYSQWKSRGWASVRSFMLKGILMALNPSSRMRRTVLSMSMLRAVDPPYKPSVAVWPFWMQHAKVRGRMRAR